MTGVGPLLRKFWTITRKLPAGQWLFSRFLGLYVPYTGSIRACILELRPGYCKVRLKDKRRVRNHLNSVHAIALCNLGEMATGLALLNALPGDARGILRNIQVNYLHKAHGTLIAECQCDCVTDNQKQEIALTGNIYNADKKLVTQVNAIWLIGPL